MTQFINISNHRLSAWSEPQLAEAERWAQSPRHTFLDIVHPPIPPTATWDEVHSLVENTLAMILNQLDLLGDAAHLSVAADDAFSAVPGAYAGSQLGTKDYWPLHGMIAHVMGEACYATLMSAALHYRGVSVIHSTTRRLPDGTFEFTAFRPTYGRIPWAFK